jgi:hypothetical protein
MILRRATKNDPKFKIRRRKNIEGSETPEHVMGYWPMTMRIRDEPIRKIADY